MSQSRILYTPREYRKPKRLFPPKGFLYNIVRIFLAFFIVAGGIYALRLPFWQLKEIQLNGLETQSSEEIKIRIKEFLDYKYAFLIPRSSFLVLRTGTLRKKLEKDFPRIEASAIAKKFPNVLKIEIKERELWGIFCQKGSNDCVYIDKTGFAYERAPNSSGSLITKIMSDTVSVQSGIQVVESSLGKEMQFLAEEFKKVVAAEVIGYELFSKIPSEIRIITNEGWQVWFSRGGNWSSTFKVLKTILEEEIKDKRLQLEYIDLRFGNKVFYKFHSK